MIEFSTKSWHYRFATISGIRENVNSLCSYVRSVMLGMLLFTLIAFFCSYIAFGTLATIAALLSGYAVSELPQWILAGATVTIGAIALGIALFGWTKCVDWREARAYAKYEREYQAKYGENSENYVPPQPSLFILYWRALHDKICPMIEFTSPTPTPALKGPGGTGDL